MWKSAGACRVIGSFGTAQQAPAIEATVQAPQFLPRCLLPTMLPTMHDVVVTFFAILVGLSTTLL
jgi:hypothetical protein